MNFNINTISGKCIPLRGNDIDTDRIIPARYLRCVTFDGLGEHAFEDDRKQVKAKGKNHPFDEPQFQNAEILIVNKNFGCGSSREHAPQSLKRWGKGIKSIIGESFAEIFFGNCCALGIPCVTVSEDVIQNLMTVASQNPDLQCTVDVDKLTITYGSESYPCQLPDGVRKSFVEGKWDSTLELLDAKEQIAAVTAKLPYFNNWE